MILRFHVPFYDEILRIPDFLQDPILSFGYQDMGGGVVDSDPPPGPNPLLPRLHRFLVSDDKVRRVANKVKSKLRPPIPAGFGYNSLTELLRARGNSVVSLDLFDERAELRYDMNQPVPVSEHQKYGTLIDVGSLEHVFDTAQCLENCMRMVRCDGVYMLHTAVNGYYGHGLHVFNPQGLIDCFGANGFKIVYLKYSTNLGKQVPDPSAAPDVLIWLVGRKEQDVPVFTCPQQKIWSSYYAPTG
jgi:hypothetical protein